MRVQKTRRACARGSRRPLSVSVGVFADLFGVHRNTVATWVREGLPVQRRRGRVTDLDLAAGIQWMRKRDLAAFEARLEAATSTPDIDAARARKVAAEADLAELERDRRRGELVQTDAVEARWGEMAHSIREGVMSLPGMAVQAAIIRPDQEATLDDLCRSALTVLSRPPTGEEGEEP